MSSCPDFNSKMEYIKNCVTNLCETSITHRTNPFGSLSVFFYLNFNSAKTIRKTTNAYNFNKLTHVPFNTITWHITIGSLGSLIMDLYSYAAHPQLSYYSPPLKHGLASHILLSVSSFRFF